MKRPKLAAAIFALAAGAIWVAEALWLRRALDSERRPKPEEQSEDDASSRLVRAPDARPTP